MNDSLPLEIEENYQTLSSKTRSEITLLDPFRQAYNFSTLYCICLTIAQYHYLALQQSSIFPQQQAPGFAILNFHLKLQQF